MAHVAARHRPPLWLELALILVLAAGLAAAMNAARPDPMPLMVDFQALARRDALRQGLETIDVSGAMAMRGRPGVVFLDARTPGEFAAGHVAGAKASPQEAMYGDLDAATQNLGLSAEDRLVVYCGGVLCDRSKELAEALRTSGYPYVTVMPDGMEGWLAAGGPTEGGS